ncbi:conserved Plasmodium protein, unknown function [Plasmodium berghei]|uniref:Protein kinase domain-containing protein n=2 Tax=Plasmodium berghei TaxID=5821 RepID=A0A509ARP5_PLABA|nr:conserved Plasmodium protein, unknown function [Plasmodium berghei ANKA]CXJ15756.1 conserved Plasmodium protein, unknown function [Plasmodium berghei]SCO62562.1 conserved Plasmodium protein, unknown function [Plasmodium berghei]VUC58253.1 conserved Plasmodium protein, unknown function [Plasmodium berghei ANKA]|eukprot:XP_034424016.1 conserved Plasmodium protein, unknown function [Plasmodium berghei ANKA]
MRFICFMTKLLILNIVALIFNRYIKNEKYEFSFFIYCFTKKNIQRNGFDGNSTQTNNKGSFESVKGNPRIISLGINNINNYVENGISSNNNECTFESDKKMQENRNPELHNSNNSYSYTQINSKSFNINNEHTNKKKDNKNKTEKIPIIYTSIDHIKKFSHIKGKLKLVYIRSFYDGNKKELYEGKFQFYKNNIIYVTTFAVVKNSLKYNFDKTDKWFIAYMNILQKNNYNITVRCKGIEKYYGLISFSNYELERFENLRKLLKSKLNITYDHLLYNLNNFYSAKRKFLEFINFRLIHPGFQFIEKTKNTYYDIQSYNQNKETFKKFNLSYDYISTSYRILIQKNFTKTADDIFLLYALFRDKLIESEESNEVIIFKTDDNNIFTYDEKYSEEIKILNKNFEIEILMGEDGYKNENTKHYFHLNDYYSLHLELQNKGVIKYDFIYTWLSKYFINNIKYKYFYLNFYNTRSFVSMENVLHDINFHVPIHYNFIEKGRKNYEVNEAKTQNEALKTSNKINESKEKQIKKTSIKYNSPLGRNKIFARNFLGFYSNKEKVYTNSKKEDKTYFDDDLRDKIYDYEHEDIIGDIGMLDSYNSINIIGMFQGDYTDLFILNWLSGNNILCVVTPVQYKEIHYNTVLSSYFNVLNKMKYGYDKNVFMISEDSKGIIINANFYPHYSNIKLFYNDENNDIFEEELKSYFLLIHFLLNSNNSPCRDYKNVKYFYDEQTFNIYNLDFISNTLFYLVSECALKLLNWDIPLGIINKNENYINVYIFNASLKYTTKKIHHHGFKLRILNNEDASKFSMVYNKSIIDNYDLKYDFFFKVASNIFVLHSLGLVHRNIKADNYLFQIKKNIDDQHVNAILRGFGNIIEEGGYGKFKGSYIYAAPEQINSYFNYSIYNLKSDIFSLGLSLSTIFLKGKFIHKYVENKIIMPQEKDENSILKRNPLAQLWIKTGNIFTSGGFILFKRKICLKFKVKVIEKQLSKKYIYEWFEQNCSSISYSKLDELNNMFKTIQNIRRLNINLKNYKYNEKRYYGNLASKNFNHEPPQKLSTSDSPIIHRFMDDIKSSDSNDESKSNSNDGNRNYISFYPFDLELKCQNFKLDYKVNDQKSKGKSDDNNMDRQNSDILYFPQPKGKKYKNKNENEDILVNNNNKDDKNNETIVQNNKLFKEIDYTYLIDHNIKEYIKGCHNLKYGIIGTIMKNFSIEFEKYRPQIFDIYLLFKNKLIYLKNKESNNEGILSILQKISEPDINTILKEKIYSKFYNINKMVLLKTLIFYGYFTLHERLSYEFKMYELQNFPLNEDNEDIFETVIIKSMNRTDFNEFSNLLLIQDIYNNYQREVEYSNIHINLYIVRDAIYTIDTAQLYNIVNHDGVKKYRQIDFKNRMDFRLNKRKKKKLNQIIDNELNFSILNPDYKSIFHMKFEYKHPIINSFIIKVDNYIKRDMNIKLAAILNEMFWGLKKNCKCINYTHMHAYYQDKNSILNYGSEQNRLIDLHKPIGNIFNNFSQNNVDMSNVNIINPMDIHLDILLRNSVHLIDKKILLDCGKKLKGKSNIYMPNISSMRKNKTIKIKIGINSSMFFYLSFNLSLLRSQDVHLKNIIYYIYKKYKSKLDKKFSFPYIIGKENEKGIPFNCLMINENNTFFYNNVTKNFVKETSLNKLLFALYNVNIMDPSYIIKSSINYYNHRGNDSILLSIVTICNVIYNEKNENNNNMNESEYFLKNIDDIYFDDNRKDEYNNGINISKKEALKNIKKENKNIIKIIHRNSTYYYRAVNCLSFLNNEFITFHNDNNITNVFDKIIIQSSIIFENQTKKLREKHLNIYINKTINFNIISNIVNFQKYEDQMYTLSDFIYEIFHWALLNLQNNGENKCTYLYNRQNASMFDMILGITTSEGRKFILYKHTEGLITFLFYNILKNQEFNKYTSEILEMAIKLHNVKIYFVISGKTNKTYPFFSNIFKISKKSTQENVVKCLKQLKGKNVNLLGDVVNEDLYIPIKIKFMNKNIVYNMSKNTFYKLLYDFNNNKADISYKKELPIYALSNLYEIQNKFQFLFLNCLRHYIDIPSKLIKNDNLFSAKISQMFYENLNKENLIHKNNYSNTVDQIITYINSTFTDNVFTIEHCIPFFPNTITPGIYTYFIFKIFVFS